MDLNIDNYSIYELIDLVGLEENVKYTKDKLKNTIDNILQDIKYEPDGKKKEITIFLNTCYDRLCEYYNITTEYVEQSIRNNEIIKHVDNVSTNSFPLKLKKGKINPLLRQLYTQDITFNTLFRPNYKDTKPTDYNCTLPNPVKNVVSMRLSSFEFPSCIYSISDTTKTNEFTVHAYDYSGSVVLVDYPETQFIIENGNYTGQELVAYMNTNFFNTSPYDRIEAEYNTINNKIIFRQSSSALPQELFNIDFRLSTNIMRPYQLNLGWLIGFREAQYNSVIFGEDIITANPIFTAESCYNEKYTKYALLHINDYNNNHTTVLDIPFQQGMISSAELIGKVSDSITNCSNWKKRIYFGPVNIERIQIRLYDQYGNIIDTNNSDYSFTLELECLYDL